MKESYRRKDKYDDPRETNEKRRSRSRSTSACPNKNVNNNAIKISGAGGYDDLELEDVEKKIAQDLKKSMIMEYKDFYEIEYDNIDNFHKKV